MGGGNTSGPPGWVTRGTNMVCAQDQPRGNAWVSTRPCGTPGLVNGLVNAAVAGWQRGEWRKQPTLALPNARKVTTGENNS